MVSSKPSAKASPRFALDSTQSAPPSGAGVRLLEWLADEGALVHADLSMALVAPLGRELVVRRPVAAGDVLIRLPPELCIAAPAAAPDGPEFSEDVRLAAALLEVEGSQYWEQYKNIWPTELELRESLPVFWPEPRLSELAVRYPSLLAQVRSRSEMLRSAAEHYGVPVDRLTWAHALVSTRAVGAGIDACAMIPGVDLANHSPKPNAELVVAGEPGVRAGKATLTKLGEVWEHGTAGLVAKTDIEAGMPVHISYGKYPNQRLLLDYGFSLGSNNPGGEQEIDDGNKP